jgi:hypothetical protein
LPLLWRDQVVGWGNLSIVDERLQASFGYSGGQLLKERAFQRALDAELENIQTFLRIGDRT